MKKLMFVMAIMLISSFAFSKTILLRSWRISVPFSGVIVEQRIYCIDGYKWLVTIPESHNGVGTTSQQMFKQEGRYDSIPITCSDK